MEAEGHAALAEEGFDPDARKLLRFADMRYLGQEHTVSLPVGPVVDAGEVTRLSAVFADAHERHYGHSMDDPIEIVTLRSRALGLVERPSLPELAKRESGEVVPVESRPVYRGGGEWLDYPVYHRDSFQAGDRIEGPAVINEHTSTTVMHRGDTALVGRLGELQIIIAKEKDRG
jgi:N-methylhydantoinase A